MTTETQATAPEQPTLGITDLQNVVAIIDTASRRGAFSANEMSAIGAVYDRVNAFLKAAMPEEAPKSE